MANKKTVLDYLDTMKRIYDDLIPEGEKFENAYDDLVHATAIFLSLPKSDECLIDCFFSGEGQFITADELFNYSVLRHKLHTKEQEKSKQDIKEILKETTIESKNDPEKVTEK